MRSIMNNPRLLFAVAVGSLVFLALASTESPLIAPCWCLPSPPGEFRVMITNGKKDFEIQVIFTSKNRSERVDVPPGSSRSLDMPAGTWTWKAYTYDDGMNPGRLVRSGSFSEPTIITITD